MTKVRVNEREREFVGLSMLKLGWLRIRFSACLSSRGFV